MLIKKQSLSFYMPSKQVHLKNEELPTFKFIFHQAKKDLRKVGQNISIFIKSDYQK